MVDTVKDKNSEIVAKKWAKALMELAKEDENISKDEILNNLKEIVQVFDSSEELTEVINNPAVTTEEKQIVICKLFQNRVSNLVYNFIFTLNLRKRLNLIDIITEEFKKELDEYNNIKHVHVTSAIEINEDKKEEIKARIASKLNASIDIEWGVDSDIIAGLVFNIDETILDNSVRYKLDDLCKNIILN